MAPRVPEGGGGGRGRPAIGLLSEAGFLGRVPDLEGAGLGSAVIFPLLDFLMERGGATGPEPNNRTSVSFLSDDYEAAKKFAQTLDCIFCLLSELTWHLNFRS